MDFEVHGVDVVLWLVQKAIELHLPVEQFEKLKAAEESERDIITRLVGKKIARRR